MADLKISQLTGATTPLAGTEVLPIVQSSTTKKVATDDLTVKNVRSNATTGILQIAGPGTGTTRTMTTPNANFTAARTDAAQSFTGDQTLGTGNLVQGTAAKGFNFTANTPAAGMTSQLLNWYEEGTFTPTIVYSGTNTPTYAYQLGRYTRIGRTVQVQIFLSWNENGSTGNVTVGGLPFTSVTSLARAVPSILSYGLTGLPANISVTGYVNSNATTIFLCLNDNAATTLSATYTDNDQDMYVTVTYEAA